MDPITQFVSAKQLSKVTGVLSKAFVKIRKDREKELIELSNTFEDPRRLAKFCVEPKCQQINPANALEDNAISVVRENTFEAMNTFFNRGFLPKDGSNQLFILADAGMGKTSLLLMIKLMHLTSFMPQKWDCKLLKLGKSFL